LWEKNITEYWPINSSDKGRAIPCVKIWVSMTRWWHDVACGKGQAIFQHATTRLSEKLSGLIKLKTSTTYVVSCVWSWQKHYLFTLCGVVGGTTGNLV
jgi:hypothetical protein